MDIITLTALSLISCVVVSTCVIICYYQFCSRYCLRHRRLRHSAENHPSRRNRVLQKVTCPIQDTGHIENGRRNIRRYPFKETKDVQDDYYYHQPWSESKCAEHTDEIRPTSVCNNQKKTTTDTQPQLRKVKAEIANLYPPHIRVTADGEEGYAAAQSSLLTFSSVNKEEVEYFFIRPPPNETISENDNSNIHTSTSPSKSTALDSPELYCLVSQKSNCNNSNDSYIIGCE